MTELPNQVREALKNVPSFKKVVVGLSGGIDSVVLTHILKRLGYDIVVAHLNHGLRGELGNRDETFVTELANAWGIPYSFSKAVIPKNGNIENSARKIRYTYLESVRQSYHADFIAVGHHFDDQIETILMHEKRGAGLRGLRGMTVVKDKIIRPMLDVPRREIEKYAKENLLDYMTDETNFHLNLERNRLRHEVIPELRRNPEFEENIRKISKEASDRLKDLGIKQQDWLDNYSSENSFERAAFNKLEKELKVEILISLLGQEDVYTSTLERMIDFIAEGKSGKELVVKGMIFVIEYEKIRFMKEEAGDLLEVEVKGEINWGEYWIQVRDIEVLRVRPWKTGDRFQPSGMEGTKKLQDFFVDQKIPRHQRKRIPILVDQNNQIVCVGNLRFSESHKNLKNSILIKKFPFQDSGIK